MDGNLSLPLSSVPTLKEIGLFLSQGIDHIRSGLHDPIEIETGFTMR